MKSNKNTINIIAGIVFAYWFLSAVYCLINLIITGALFDVHIKSLILVPLEAVVSGLLCLYAFKHNKRPKWLNILAIIFICTTILNYISSLFSYGSFDIIGLISISLFIAAFILSGKASKDSIPDIKNASSEAEKSQIQTDKQTSIYNDQLRNGIITQEEYDQIMNNKND